MPMKYPATELYRAGQKPRIVFSQEEFDAAIAQGWLEHPLETPAESAEPKVAVAPKAAEASVEEEEEKKSRWRPGTKS